MNPSPDDVFNTWLQGEELAESMVPIIGSLYRDRDIVVSIYGRPLVRESATAILKAHRYARQITNSELSLTESHAVLSAIASRPLDSARVDLGKLTTGYAKDGEGRSIDEYLDVALAPISSGSGRLLNEPTDIVLYGFGRIGRLLARILIERTGSGAKLRLRGIVLRPGSQDDAEKRASLLRRDSVHGPFSGTIKADNEKNQIIANGNVIQLIYANSPSEVDYTAHGISNAIVIDNTGIWRDEEGLGQHLQSPGVQRVLLTAPGKGAIKNIIYGVNDGEITESDRALSAASCTTNAIVPVLKAMHDKYEVVSGHLETVHAYTNDQNLTDNFHKKARRGRSAPLNLVITETGAATAVAKALPELAGRLTGNAIRVPTPNVSLAILNLELGTAADRGTINSYLRGLSVDSPLRDQLDYTSSEEIVSSDLVGSNRAGIVDSKATIVNGSRCVLYVWYDNEAGYSYQVVRIVQDLAGVNYPSVP
ncbi:MAG: glyceraldehyde-3-phosphate dehydrogenase [Acidimicrobiales bacterium]|jgi:glyceraldehyde 3-phosphate dehydrogenase